MLNITLDQPEKPIHLGDTITGVCEWHIAHERLPIALELRWEWRTDDKSCQDSKVEATYLLTREKQGTERFALTLPTTAPPSYQGTLIEIKWFLCVLLTPQIQILGLFQRKRDDKKVAQTQTELQVSDLLASKPQITNPFFSRLLFTELKVLASSASNPQTTHRFFNRLLFNAGWLVLLLFIAISLLHVAFLIYSGWTVSISATLNYLQYHVILLFFGGLAISAMMYTEVLKPTARFIRFLQIPKNIFSKISIYRKRKVLASFLIVSFSLLLFTIPNLWPIYKHWYISQVSQDYAQAVEHLYPSKANFFPSEFTYDRVEVEIKPEKYLAHFKLSKGRVNSAWDMRFDPATRTWHCQPSETNGVSPVFLPRFCD